MNDLQGPINLIEKDIQENDQFKEQFAISKFALYIFLLSVCIGITLIFISSVGVIPMPLTILRLIRLLGVILSTPIFLLLFNLYQYFIPPFYLEPSDEINIEI